MAAKKTTTRTCFVLPVEAASSAETQMIPGVPGAWVPGEPVDPIVYGVSVDEMRAAVEEAGLGDVIVETDVKVALDDIAEAQDAVPVPEAPLDDAAGGVEPDPEATDPEE